MLEDSGKAEFQLWCFRRLQAGMPMGVRVYSRLLAKMWTGWPSGEGVGTVLSQAFIPWQTLLEMFALADPKYLMESRELGVFRALPPLIIAYRGCGDGTVDEALAGMSWSLRWDHAEWYAYRLPSLCTPIVVKAIIPRRYVFAYFYQNYEIVVQSGRARYARLVTLRSGKTVEAIV
jgi:hypothetical protein